MAEIEHFVHPDHKEHPRFVEVANTELNLFSQEAQLGEVKKPFLMTVGEAVSKGIIANETLGYFIARCHLFLMQIGIDPLRLRFRQHLKHEMAHYAADCWDAEIQSSFGWVECVGLADRSAFDLKAHTDKSKIDLVAYERFSEPIQEEVTEVKPNMQAIGKVFKRDAKVITEALAALSSEDAFALQDAVAANGSAPLKTDGGEFQIATGMVTVAKVTKTVNGRSYTPSVIEPSFGIGRIMYCMFEHAFYIRPDDEQKVVLRLTPVVAPIKTTIFPLVNVKELNDISIAMNKSLTSNGISAKLDTTAISIGKRYARTDELGVPFAVTVDHRSTTDATVTVRERDSCGQVRVPIPQVPELLRKLCNMSENWATATAHFEKQATAADDA
jgi:glycyl-tRNA synthetase